MKFALTLPCFLSLTILFVLFIPVPLSYADEIKILVYEDVDQTINRAQDFEALSRITQIDGSRVTCAIVHTLPNNRLEDYDILWLGWCALSSDFEYKITPEEEEAIKKYVEDGGFVWATTNDNNGFQTGWLPYPIELADSDDYPVEVTKAAGNLFTKPNVVDVEQVVWDEYFFNIDTAHYDILVHRRGMTDAALVQAKYGDGLYLLGCVDTRNVVGGQVDMSTFTPLFENVIAKFISEMATVVTVESKVVNPEEQFTLEISTRLKVNNLHSFAFDLTFDPSVLRAVSVKEGPFLGRDDADATSWRTPTIDNTNGVIRDIRCSRAGEEGVGDTGVLATVAFEALNMGSTALALKNLRLLSPTGMEILARTKQGRVDVYPHGSISGMVLDAASNKPIKGAKVEVSKGNFTIGIFTHSADDGTYTLNSVPVGDFDVTASKDDYISETISNVRVEQGKNTPDINIKITSFDTASAITIPTPIEVGETAPDFTLSDIDGKQVSLSDFKGKLIIVNFWDSNSEHCRRQIEHLDALYKKYQGDGLVVIGVNKEIDHAAVLEFASSQISYIVLWDGEEAFTTYGVSGIPCTYYIDKAGKVHARDVGFPADGKNQMEQRVNKFRE